MTFIGILLGVSAVLLLLFILLDRHYCYSIDTKEERRESRLRKLKHKIYVAKKRMEAWRRNHGRR